MQWKNTENKFGLVSKLLHWIMAIMIITLLTVGLVMTNLADSDMKWTIYGMHKSFGLVVLAMAICRLVWRFINIVPKLVSVFWERMLARGVHALFYILMIMMPLSGWLMSSAGGYTIPFFGLFNVPFLIPKNESLGQLFGQAHEWIGYGLIALITLHILASFKHHIIDKDDILKRML